jgi:hypothetical protein
VDELEKKIYQQKNGSRKKSKQRNVTFATDDNKLLSSKSVKGTSRLVLHSDL